MKRRRIGKEMEKERESRGGWKRLVKRKRTEGEEEGEDRGERCSEKRKIR